MGGQKVEIWDFAKTDHGARLVNTFYPTNGPQTSKSAEFVSMNPPNSAHIFRIHGLALGVSMAIIWDDLKSSLSIEPIYGRLNCPPLKPPLPRHKGRKGLCFL